jgi:DNA-binding CsgD family transcriptional regulator
MLLFASLEEYCLRPVRNQPLLTHRFVNYLRRIQRGGLTQIPGKDVIRLVSDEVLTEDTESSLNLLDDEAIAQYQEAQKVEEQQLLRQEVREKFEEYLLEKLGQTAVEWLRLYLEGKSQEEIAKKLNQPIRELYRLREKISYHAVKVFAIKDKPELIENWLSTSLKEDGLGLTPKQWEQLGEKISPLGKEILDRRKAGDSLAGIGEKLQLKTHKVIGEWTKVYLVAQNLRAQT